MYCPVLTKSAEFVLLRDARGIDLRVNCMPCQIDIDDQELAKAPAWMQLWHVAGYKKTDELVFIAFDMHRIEFHKTATFFKSLSIPPSCRTG